VVSVPVIPIRESKIGEVAISVQLKSDFDMYTVSWSPKLEILRSDVSKVDSPLDAR